MVTRFREYNNSDTRIQEIRITNDKVKWEKVFAFNGWQVLDSVTYNGNEKITYKGTVKDTKLLNTQKKIAQFSST